MDEQTYGPTDGQSVKASYMILWRCVSATKKTIKKKNNLSILITFDHFRREDALVDSLSISTGKPKFQTNDTYSRVVEPLNYK